MIIKIITIKDQTVIERTFAKIKRSSKSCYQRLNSLRKKHLSISNNCYQKPNNKRKNTHRNQMIIGTILSTEDQMIIRTTMSIEDIMIIKTIVI